ncbi:hypothetical protein B0H16DRAFT_1515610, partial [Mycena metata]
MSASKLFIGNLSWHTTDDSLNQVGTFSAHGEVTDSIVMKDRETGKSRGFGFVTFSTDAEAQKAIDCMNDQDLDGRQIRVNIAQGRGGGGGGGGGSYGGGGGGYGGGSSGGYDSYNSGGAEAEAAAAAAPSGEE